jgi:hypothetical protein
MEALRRFDREGNWVLEVHQREQVGCIVRDLMRYMRQEILAEQPRKVLEGSQEDQVLNGPSRTGSRARYVLIATSTLMVPTSNAVADVQFYATHQVCLFGFNKAQAHVLPAWQDHCLQLCVLAASVAMGRLPGTSMSPAWGSCYLAYLLLVPQGTMPLAHLQQPAKSALLKHMTTPQQNESFVRSLVMACITGCIPFSFIENPHLVEAAKAIGVTLPSRRVL